MSKALFFSLFAVLLSTSAGAATLSASAELPVLQNVSLASVGGGGMTAVQPQAVVKFSYSSCAEFSFDVESKEKDGILFLSIVAQNGIDCFGPSTQREYSVQYSSDAMENSKVVILNPQTLYAPVTL